MLNRTPNTGHGISAEFVTKVGIKVVDSKDEAFHSGLKEIFKFSMGAIVSSNVVHKTDVRCDFLVSFLGTHLSLLLRGLVILHVNPCHHSEYSIDIRGMKFICQC